MKRDFSFSAPEIKKKVVVISDAHKLNIESQNALLKILEEPSQDLLFILETHSLESLLSTIKSRCWIINFPPLNRDEVYKFFFSQYKDKIPQETFDKIFNLFNGNNLDEIIELLNEYINNSEDVKIDDSFSFIDLFRAIYVLNFNKAFHLLEKYGVNESVREKSNELVFELQNFCKSIIATKLELDEKRSELIKLSEHINISKLSKLIDFLNNFEYLNTTLYINIKSLWLKIFLLINNSFIKKR